MHHNYDFKVEVYGPEFHAKKRDLLPHTLHHLIDTSFQLNKIKYAEADEITRGLLTSDLPFHTEGNNKYFSFNPQVLAPYLLVFKYSRQTLFRFSVLNNIIIVISKFLLMIHITSIKFRILL